MMTGCTRKLPVEERFVSDYRTIKTVYELGDNYINHMYLMAMGPTYDQPYYESYKSTVSIDNLKMLKDNADYMAFDNKNFAYSSYLYFIPAKYNFNTKVKWEIYFKDLLAFIDGSNETFLTSYNLENYFGSGIDPQSVELEVMNKLSEIYIESFDKYKKDVWTEVIWTLHNKSIELNDILEKMDLIGEWERATGHPYIYDEYVVSLFYSGKSGPQMNNLGSNKNLMYYQVGGNTEEMIQLMSHELGVQMLMPYIYKYYSSYIEDYGKYSSEDFPVNEMLYISLEEFVAYFNSKVFDKRTCDYDLFYTREDHVLYNVIIPAREAKTETAAYLYKLVIDYYMESAFISHIRIEDGQVFQYGETYERVHDFESGEKVYVLDNWSIVLVADDQARELSNMTSVPSFSLNGDRMAFIDGYEFEFLGQLVIYDSKTKATRQMTYLTMEGEQTVKRAVWIDENHMLLVIGYRYGTASYGGNIYTLDIRNYELIQQSELPEDEEYSEIEIVGDQAILNKINWDENVDKFTTEKVFKDLEALDYE